MDKTLRILIIDDSEYDCELMLYQLKKAGYKVIWQRVDNGEKMVETLKKEQWDVILSDHSMPGFNSMEALKIKKELNIETPFIIVSGKIGEEQAVEAMKNGCQDYLSKDKLTGLVRIIEREIEEARIRAEHKQMQEELNEERERLDITLRSIGDGVITTDISGKIVFINEKAEELTGWKQAEANGKILNEIFKVADEKNNGITLELFDDAINKHKDRGLKSNSKLISRDGSKRYISANISPILKNEREMTGVVVVFRDISRLKNMEMELSNEQLNLNTIFNAAPIGMIIVDGDTKVVKANDAVFNMLNTSEEEVLGKPIGSALKCINDSNNQSGCGDSKECINCNLRKTILEVFQSGIPESGVEVMHQIILRGKLKKIWFNISSVPIAMDGKKHTVIVLNNITEQKQYEENIKKSRDFYLTLFENFPGLIWRTNKNKESDYFNNNWYRFTGTNLTHDKGFGWLECVNDKDRGKCLTTFVENFDRRQPFEIEYRLRRFDGQYRWILCTGRPFYDLNGKFAGYINIANDITGRKIAEEGLKRYQILSEKAKDLILFTDIDGKIIDANSAAFNTYGYTKGEMLTKTIFDLNSQDENEYIKWQLEIASRDGVVFETIHYKKDGSPFFVEVSSSGTVIQNKKVILSVLRDITERKIAEKELKEAKESAEAANRAKSEFLANMSHEIRTPLNGIIGMTDLTLMTNLTEEQREDLNIVKSSGNSLLKVINDILDFSKIEAGKMYIEELSFSSRELIKKVYMVHLKQAQRKNINLSFKIDENIPETLIGDSSRLEQILNNLVSNAVKFTDRGRINIEVEKTKGELDNIQLQFQVSDTGIGIANEDKDKLFKNFSQVDGSITRRYGGTGLGLAICKRLVEMMKGQIWVESVPNKGSSFYFTVKLKVDGEKELGNYLAGDKGTGNISPAKKSIRILVAEDDKINQMVVGSMLKVKGYSMDIANNGIEVLSLLSDKNYDAVLMDIRMPEMDGIEATRLIREKEKLTNSHIPIIALTAHAIQGDKEKFLASGMDYYLSKPVQMEELYKTIDKAMEERKIEYASNNITDNNTVSDKLLENEESEAIKKISFEINKLRKAVDKGDFSLIENSAHYIKEMSSNLKDDKIKGTAFKIELNARKEKHEDIKELYQILVKKFEEVSLLYKGKQ